MVLFTLRGWQTSQQTIADANADSVNGPSCTAGVIPDFAKKSSIVCWSTRVD